MINQKIYAKWLKIVLLNFLIAAVMGVLMRLAFLVELPFNYRNILHAHSHVALLGWLYGAFFILIIYSFDLKVERFSRLFWVTQLSVLGMLLSFPIQGYGAFSISFSVLHIICSYVFVVRVINEIKRRAVTIGYAEKFLFTALFFLVLSTMGTWALGPIMNSSLKGSPWYYSAIQFFLHFQFNGWFVFAVIAIFLKNISKLIPIKHVSLIKSFYLFLLISCFLTFALAITWSNPDQMLFWVNSLGVILQLLAWSFFCRWIWLNRDSIRKVLSRSVYFLWLLSFISLSIKIIVQSLVAIPSVAVISYTIHNFVIGFIHLLMLGCLSIFIFGFIDHIKIWISKSRVLKMGTWIFICGIITTEALLFYQGCRLWLGTGFIMGYYELLFGFSMLLPIGVGVYWSGSLSDKNMKN